MAVAAQSKKEWESNQEPRWCPGCGDYAILNAVAGFMPELEIPPERVVFIAGIGCSGRFAYYMNTYGMHAIHGRALPLATGIAVTRPDLSVWVVTGDGDSLSIGGNHLIHALRRNVPLKILLFNNQIYGLTKGQYSPTSEVGKVTKSTPFGALDHPFNPLALALGAEASFAARTLDVDRNHLTDVLRQAAAHRGTAFIEIYQNCPVFNDHAFDALTDKETRAHNQIRLVHGEPIRFGPDGEHGVVQRPDGGLELVEVADVGADALLVHDAHRADPSLAFSLAHLTERPTSPTPLGVFRAVERPVYGDALDAQVEDAKAKLGPGDLSTLLHSGDTWVVGD
ncbi:MAG: 2-oxoacid:ferredoxin oxidoreductase subunit beta [Gaiellales bacterium]